VQGAALTFVFVAAIHFKDWPISRLLNHPTMAFLGVLSYSIYLVHFPILHAFKAILYMHQLTASALALVASIGIAWLIYLIVEKPCAQLRRRFVGHGKAEQQHAKDALAGRVY
jgi:peptidoglycan/LPS O-acetylase OafA/YrhL